MSKTHCTKNVLFLFFLCLIFFACAGKEKSSEKAAEKGGAAGALTAVYADYLEVKNALVKSDAAKAQSEAKELVEAVKKESTVIPPDHKSDWEQHTGAVVKAAGDIAQTTILADQRKAFADLSMALEAGVKKIGLSGTTVYKEYCPMALDSKGASWLSEKKNIENPYFGDEMLTCGSIEETMKY